MLLFRGLFDFEVSSNYHEWFAAGRSGRPASLSLPENLEMRRILRTCLVGLCVLVMTINPAWACRYCGGGWGGGYRSSGPVYYGYGGYGGGCGGSGGYYGGCGGCGYAEVVDDCCGSSCDGCGQSGAVIDQGLSEPSHQPTKAAPTEAEEMRAPSTAPAQPERPSRVERPVDSAPAPALPAGPPQPVPPNVPLPSDENAPPTPPSNDLFESPPAPPAAPTEKPP
jgi:hypothetical protein